MSPHSRPARGRLGLTQAEYKGPSLHPNVKRNANSSVNGISKKEKGKRMGKENIDLKDEVEPPEEGEENLKPGFKAPPSIDDDIFRPPLDSDSEDDKPFRRPDSSSEDEPERGNIVQSDFSKNNKAAAGSSQPKQSSRQNVLRDRGAKKDPSQSSWFGRKTQVAKPPKRSKPKKVATEEKEDSEEIDNIGEHLESSVFSTSSSLSRRKKKVYGSQRPAVLSSHTEKEKSPKPFKAPIVPEVASESDEESPAKRPRLKIHDLAEFLGEDSSDKETKFKKPQDILDELLNSPQRKGFVAPNMSEAEEDVDECGFKKPELPAKFGRCIKDSFDTWSGSEDNGLPTSSIKSSEIDLPEETSFDEFSQTQRPGFQTLPPELADIMGDISALSQVLHTTNNPASSTSSSRQALTSLELSDPAPESPTASQLEAEELSKVQPVSECPLCGDVVPTELLRSYSNGKRMGVSKQASFCRHHKKHTAREAYTTAKYPQIDWSILDDRIAAHHEFIKAILDGSTDSYYRNVLADGIKSGTTGRTLRQAVMTIDGDGKPVAQSLTPGYYGTRGLRAISENLLNTFSPTLRTVAIKDRLVSSRGVTGYVESVLVPEVAVRLVCEDLGVGLSEARTILKESVTLGHAVNEEIEEVVTRADEEDDLEGVEGDNSYLYHD